MSFLRKYFELFLKNFDAKRDFHFNLSKGEATVSNLGRSRSVLPCLLPRTDGPPSETGVALAHPPDVNDDVVRELIGVETLLVKRLFVSNCRINVTVSNLTGVPVVIAIDEVDIVLAVRRLTEA